MEGRGGVVRWVLRQPATIGLGMFTFLAAVGAVLGGWGGVVAGVVAGHCALIALVVAAFFGVGKGVGVQMLLTLLALALVGLVFLELATPGGLAALLADLQAPSPD